MLAAKKTLFSIHGISFVTKPNNYIYQDQLASGSVLQIVQMRHMNLLENSVNVACMFQGPRVLFFVNCGGLEHEFSQLELVEGSVAIMMDNRRPIVHNCEVTGVDVRWMTFPGLCHTGTKAIFLVSILVWYECCRIAI